MNAPIALPIPRSDVSIAIEAVNCWRGHCLALFAAAEESVSEALLTLAAVNPAMSTPRLLGGRLEALTAACPDAAEQIAALQAFDPLRNFLCHGTAQIGAMHRGGWLAAFTLIKLSTRATAERSLVVIDDREASELLDALKRDSERLRQKLRTLVPRAEPVSEPLATLRVGVRPA